MIKTIIRENNYMDSIFLMTVSREINKINGVKNAVVVMGSDMNKTVLKEFGGLTKEAAATTPNDLIISVDIESEDLSTTIEQKINELILKKSFSVSDAEVNYRTLFMAADANPEANLTIISVPGEFAAQEIRNTLQRGMNAFVFSDNVPLEEEVELKNFAKEKGLLVMGPGCGTAVINGISIGLMSKVRKGSIGIVGASGSGIQEIAVLVHNYGEGITQAIGTGGRDLSLDVGGITMLQGIEYLAEDPDTKVIVLVSKPPHPKTAKKIYEALPKKKPIVIFFLGGDPEEIRKTGAYAATSLEEAAYLAVALTRDETIQQTNFISDCKAELMELAAQEKAKLLPTQKYLRGLFCGGTHSEEAVLMLQDLVPDLYSNIHFGKVSPLISRHISIKNTLIDMGDEEFTKGRPHPVMDPSILCDRLLKEAEDPQTAVILFDLLMGHGAHKDPVGTLESTFHEIREKTSKEGRNISIICSVCGTDIDPQNCESQIKQLSELGVHVMPSNSRAAILSGLILR